MKSLIISIGLSTVCSLQALNIKKIENAFKGRIKKYTLNNGLRVILMKNGISPTIACYLKVGVGSSNEPFDQSGTAHFLEHLLFKGTSQLGTKNFEIENLYLKQIYADGERLDAMNRKLLDPIINSERRKQLFAKKKIIEKRLRNYEKFVQRFVISEEDSQAYALAGQVGYNAYTSSDVTNYQIKLPKNRLKLWAWLESSRFLNPIFREFYTERKVILEERRMRTDSRPSSLLHELFLKTAFGLSPYGKPVIGFKSNILKMTQKETRDFFDRNYIPSRMVISIVGDIDFNETISVIKEYFGRLPKKPEPTFPAIEFEGQLGKKTVVLSAKHSPMLITGWHKPSIQHKDDYIFEVLSTLLTSGKTARLTKRLVIDRRLVSSIRSYNGNPGSKLNNTFSIYITPFKEKDYSKVNQIIAEELKRLVEEGPTEQELEKVKNIFYADLISSLNSNAGLANSLTYYELLMNDYNYFFDFLKQVDTIKKDDIQRIVKKYFIEKNNTTVYIKNRG